MRTEISTGQSQVEGGGSYACAALRWFGWLGLVESRWFGSGQLGLVALGRLGSLVEAICVGLYH